VGARNESGESPTRPQQGAGMVRRIAKTLQQLELPADIRLTLNRFSETIKQS
jgi:hypothetical protein